MCRSRLYRGLQFDCESISGIEFGNQNDITAIYYNFPLKIPSEKSVALCAHTAVRGKITDTLKITLGETCINLHAGRQIWVAYLIISPLATISRAI